MTGLGVRRFAALGDSLSAGAEGDTAIPWPELASRALATGGAEPAFRNFAVAGATSADVVIWQLQQAVEFDPDLISLICGASDVLLFGGTDPEAFAAVFDLIVDWLRRRLPHALIVTATYPRVDFPLPLREQTGAWLGSGLETINTTIREIAARRGVTCLDWDGHPGISDRENFVDDRFHPSAEGHRRLAAAFVEVLTAADGPCGHGGDTE